MTEDALRILGSVGVVVVTLAFVVQAAIMIALYRVSTKTERALTKFIGDVKPFAANAGTALASATRIMDDNRPGVREVVVDAVAIARSGRARLQQIDSAVDSAVARVEHVGDAVKNAASKPVKEVNGLAAGISAAVSTLVHGSRPADADPGQASCDSEPARLAEMETGQPPDHPHAQEPSQHS